MMCGVEARGLKGCGQDAVFGGVSKIAKFGPCCASERLVLRFLGVYDIDRARIAHEVGVKDVVHGQKGSLL